MSSPIRHSTPLQHDKMAYTYPMPIPIYLYDERHYIMRKTQRNSGTIMLHINMWLRNPMLPTQHLIVALQWNMKFIIIFL